LSVILVSWNTCDELQACLESVVAGVQGISAELVVVDNASSDGSADMVAERFPDVRLVRNPENLGFAAGCNAGLELATGRYVLLLNPDTIVLDDVLAATVRYLDEHPDVGTLGCRVLNADGSLQPSCFRDPSVLNTFLGLTGLAKLPWPPLPRPGAHDALAPRQRARRRGGDGLLPGDAPGAGRRCRAARRRILLLRRGSGLVPQDARPGLGPALRPGGRHRPSRRRGRAQAQRAAGPPRHGRLVRYADHHDGHLAGWAMSGLLWAHAASRAAGFWAVASTTRNDERRQGATARHEHFLRVLKRYREVRELAGLRPATTTGT
jgi:hypothetical protein